MIDKAYTAKAASNVIDKAYCKGIYAGCCATGCQGPCAPCERIRLGTSTIEKEEQRKKRAEHRHATVGQRSKG